MIDVSSDENWARFEVITHIILSYRELLEFYKD
jgi:hypothetical protein